MGVWSAIWLGSTDSEVVFDAIEALNQTIRTETDHVAPIQAEVGLDTDLLTLRSRCQRCGRTWGYAFLMPLMLGEPMGSSGLMLMGADWGERWVRRELIPYGVEIMETPCHSLVGRQVIQELVTTWLRDAGAMGLPYARVLGKLLLCDLDDTSNHGEIAPAIKALELEERPVDGTQMLFLPEGHPDRSW